MFKEGITLFKFIVFSILEVKLVWEGTKDGMTVMFLMLLKQPLSQIKVLFMHWVFFFTCYTERMGGYFGQLFCLQAKGSL